MPPCGTPKCSDQTKHCRHNWQTWFCKVIKNKLCLWNTDAPSGNKVQNGYFKNKGHGQGHKVIDLGVIWKGFISRVCMQNMKSLSLTVQKLWPRLKFLIKIAIFRTQGHGRGHKVIDLVVIWKGFISRVGMPNMKSLSLTVQKLWPRLKFCHRQTDRLTDRVTDRQTDQKLDPPEFHSGGIKSWNYGYAN